MQEDNVTEEYTDYDGQEASGKEGIRLKAARFLKGPYFTVLVVILVAVIAFSLGRISGLEDKREPVRVINSGGEVKGAATDNPLNPPYTKGETGTNNQTSPENSGQVVASKSGTKYHYPWCAGAKQISEKNKIIFDSIEEARAAGYTPASNCKGLK